MKVELLPNVDNLRNKKANLLKLKDWTNLALYLLTNDAVSPGWMLVKNREAVRKFVMVVVPGLHPQDLIEGFRTDLPVFPAPSKPLQTKFNDLNVLPFSHAITTQGPAEKTHLHPPALSLLQVALTAKQKAEKKKALANSKSHIEPHSLDDLKLNDYPLREEHEEVPEGWIDTLIHGSKEQIMTAAEEKKEIMEQDGFTIVSKNAKKAAKFPVFALDCEMCITKLGMEVTRVTLVEEEEHSVVYDSLVMPENPITDYNTKFSGITEEMMTGITKSLKDVQLELLEFIKHDTVLIGHSLENDLKCLKMIHRKVIDTALLFHSSRGPPHKPKLRWLAQTYLNKIIQNGTEGHDSAEDARTCLELYNLKKFKGNDFGVSIDETESVFLRLQRAGKKTAMVDNDHQLKNYGKDADVQYKSDKDDEVVENMKKAILEDDCDFVYGRLSCLYSRNHGSTSNDKDGELESGNAKDRTYSEEFKALSDNLKSICDALPKNSVVVVVSGHGDTLAASKLLDERKAYAKLKNEIGAVQLHSEQPEKVFGPDKMALLDEAIKTGRLGVGMYGVKMSEGEVQKNSFSFVIKDGKVVTSDEA